MTDPQRRRDAKRLMDGLTVACVTVAIAIGTTQLVTGGLQEFLNRPPGVGASPSELEEPPDVAQVVPPPPPPAPQADQRHRHRSYSTDGDRHASQFR